MLEWLMQAQRMETEFFVRIALAAVLAGIIGAEREWRGRPAGLRTNMLVGVGSCLFTIISIEGFPLKGQTQDTARIAAQVVTGVGFLGAGTVVQTKGKTKGLTTAATIWLIAALGMAVGVGNYYLSIYTTLLVATILGVLNPLSLKISRHSLRERRSHRKKALEQEEQESEATRGE